MKLIKFLIVLLIFSYSIFALTQNEINLFSAINQKNSDEVANILANSTNININILDEEGYTPLHRAVYNNDLTTVKELLKIEDVNINSKLDMKVSIDGWYLGGSSPLILASYLGNAEIVKALLENGANIKAKDGIDGSMPIHMASANGNNNVIKILLLEDNSIVNDVDNRGNTPLHWAAMKDKPDTIKLLIENGADIEAKDTDDWTALHYAAAFSSFQTVQTLVDLGANKESITKDGNYPVYYARDNDVKTILSSDITLERDLQDNTLTEDRKKESLVKEETKDENIEEDNISENIELDIKQLELLVAVKNNDIIAINLLIDEGVNPNFQDEDGYSPLHLAVINDNLDTVLALLKYKDIDKEIKLPYSASLSNWYLGGATPLVVASYIGNSDIFYALLDAGSNIRARDDIDGGMSIHIASANGNNDIVVILLENDKTLINELDNTGDTPLHWAAMKDKQDTINILLGYGADSKIQNDDGNTALHYASMYASSPVIESIVNVDRTSINITNNDEMYPLHCAAFEDNVDALIALFEYGNCDINTKDSSNDTPLHYAAAYGNINSVMALVEKCNANKLLRDSDGFTAADLASNNGYENIASYLRGYSKNIPVNNDKQELVLPEYIKKPNLDKKWW